MNKYKKLNHICHRICCFLCHSWWCHQMEIFSALLALCEGNPPVTGGFPSQRPVTRSFAVFFDLHLTKRATCDLRCHCTHYDITVMYHQSFGATMGVYAIPTHLWTPHGKLSKLHLLIITERQLKCTWFLKLRLRLRLRLRQCLFNQNRYRYHIRFTKKHQYTIAKYSWYMINLRHVGRPPLRSYLTADMGATIWFK